MNIDDVITAYKTKNYSKISASTARRILIEKFGENYVEVLNTPKHSQKECEQIQKLYEHGLQNKEIAQLYGITNDLLNEIITNEYKKRKIKKPRVINKKAFRVLACKGIPIQKIQKQAEEQNSIIPDEYIEEYIDPNNFEDTNSIRRKVLEILEDRRKNEQTINFSSSFEFAEFIKDKGYSTKYQATALIYKLVNDNSGITIEDFELKNDEVKQALEILLNNSENQNNNDITSLIKQELNSLEQKNEEER